MTPEKFQLMVALASALSAGLAVGAAISAWLWCRRAERVLRRALKDRLGMDDAFVERLKREFFGGDTKKEKSRRPS
jgi:uncharacterized membrane protein YciS (DUF1049 family)